ncbi:MAG: hypothetical protein ACR2PL_10595, partial [Dehalococcoidia bacterium]
ITRLLRRWRLLTVTGAGGSGKTRRALHLSVKLKSRFPGGIWPAGLASVTDPARVPQAILSALHLREAVGCELTDILVQSLAGRRTMLLLDNCEHLLDACAELVEGMLRRCPELHILATSRERLGVAGEQV